MPQPELKPAKQKAGRSRKQPAAVKAAADAADKFPGRKASADNSEKQLKASANRQDTSKSKTAVGVEDESVAGPSAQTIKGKSKIKDIAASKEQSHSNASVSASRPPQTAKRKRGEGSADDSKQPEQKSRGKGDQQPSKKSKSESHQQVAPEKLSASARLRKGLPPTPPLRISPRGATAEAAAADESGAQFNALPPGNNRSKGKAKASSRVENPEAAATEDSETGANATEPAVDSKGKAKASSRKANAEAAAEDETEPAAPEAAGTSNKGKAKARPGKSKAILQTDGLDGQAGCDQPVVRRTSSRLK